MTEAKANPESGDLRASVDEGREFLAFEVAAERFALPLSHVREVMRAVAIRRVPDAPEVIEGLIDVRGSLIPVLDVRRRVGLPRKSLELEDRLIVVETAERTLALRVDHVHWILKLDERAIESTRRIAPGAAYLAGVARLADGLVLIHDLQRFLSESEATLLARALELQGAEGRRGT